MSAALPRPMTREEFFRWAESQDGRHEFDGAGPIAMTGGTNAHGRISANLLFALMLRLRGGPCEAMPSEGGGIATIGGRIRYPDATVVCGPLDAASHLLEHPVAVFEVTSPSSAREDRIAKLREYQSVPTIRACVIIESDGRSATVLSRDVEAEPFRAAALTEHDTIDLPAIGISIPLAELHPGVAAASP